MRSVVITAERLAEWERHLSVLETKLQRLEGRRSQLERRLAAARLLLDDFEESVEPESSQSDIAEAEPIPEAVAVANRLPTYPEEVLRVLKRRDGPVSASELKAEISAGPLSKQFSLSDKGYYHALARLSAKGQITRHGGWIFSAEVYERFVREQILDSVPKLDSRQRKSPLADVILKIVSGSSEGFTSGQVIERLEKDPLFKDKFVNGYGGVYNVISRLVKNGRLLRDGKKLFSV